MKPNMTRFRFALRLLFRLGLIACVIIDIILVVALVGEGFDTDPVVPVVVIPDTPVSSSSSAVTVPTATSTPIIQTNALVVRTVDGDTLDVRIDGEDKDQRIRLLGIDTPETLDPRRPVECFGKVASDYMKTLLEGKRVLLMADVLADERDKYDRLLRNVFLEDGTDVNALMVREGYASAYLSFPLDPVRKRMLKDLEKDAKLKENGLWSPNTCNGRA
jgi:micrococcal nuclease